MLKCVINKNIYTFQLFFNMHKNIKVILQSYTLKSKSCGPVVVDGPWMQTRYEFDPAAAETKSHCPTHHGCGYVRMKIWERVCRELHLPHGG